MYKMASPSLHSLPPFPLSSPIRTHTCCHPTVLQVHNTHHSDHTHSVISMQAQPVLQQPRDLESARQVKDVPHEGEVPAPIALDPTENFTFEQLQLMMGVSLVLGFTFMLIIDQVGGGGHSHSTGWLNTKLVHFHKSIPFSTKLVQ